MRPSRVVRCRLHGKGQPDAGDVSWLTDNTRGASRRPATIKLVQLGARQEERLNDATRRSFSPLAMRRPLRRNSRRGVIPLPDQPCRITCRCSTRRQLLRDIDLRSYR